MTEKKEQTDSKEELASPLQSGVMRPGGGWKHICGPVWEHISGARIHTMGMIALPSGYRSISNWEEGKLGRLLIKINGGNVKRGLMAWAINLAGE